MQALIRDYQEIREKVTGKPSPSMHIDSHKGEYFYIMEGYTRKIYIEILQQWIEVLKRKLNK